MIKVALAPVLFLAATLADAGTINGRVIQVLDGATITVLAAQGASLHRVRIAGIHVPDKDQRDTSRASLRRIAGGKTVRVETNAIDAKGMLVGVVHIVRAEVDCPPDSCVPVLDPGLSQLVQGLAIIDKTNLGLQTSGAQERYVTAEAHARKLRLGFWRDSEFPVRAARVARQ